MQVSPMGYKGMRNDTDDRFEETFARLGRWAPFTAGFMGWVRSPRALLVRIPLALLLILGGIFSFLPVLGIWMLPLGLLILAIDIRPLRGPVVSFVVWIEGRLAAWRAWRDRRRR